MDSPTTSLHCFHYHQLLSFFPSLEDTNPLSRDLTPFEKLLLPKGRPGRIASSCQIFPTVSPICWRFTTSEGTMTHIWCGYPLLNKLWQQVLALYTALYTVIVPNDPKIVLSILPGTIYGMKKGLLRFFLTVTRAIIPRHWKSTTSPSMRDQHISGEIH